MTKIFARLKIKRVRDGSKNSFIECIFEPASPPPKPNTSLPCLLLELLCEEMIADEAGVGGLTSSLRLDGAERRGGKALSATSRSGCKTWKTKKVFTVRKYPAICGKEEDGANIAHGMPAVRIIAQPCLKRRLAIKELL